MARKRLYVSDVQKEMRDDMDTLKVWLAKKCANSDTRIAELECRSHTWQLDMLVPQPRPSLLSRVKAFFCK